MVFLGRPSAFGWQSFTRNFPATLVVMEIPCPFHGLTIGALWQCKRGIVVPGHGNHVPTFWPSRLSGARLGCLVEYDYGEESEFPCSSVPGGSPCRFSRSHPSQIS